MDQHLWVAQRPTRIDSSAWIVDPAPSQMAPSITIGLGPHRAQFVCVCVCFFFLCVFLVCISYTAHFLKYVLNRSEPTGMADPFPMKYTAASPVVAPRAAAASSAHLAVPKHPGVLMGANPAEDTDLTQDTTSFHFNVSSVTLCRANQPAAATEQLLRVLAGENEVVFANAKAVVLRSRIGGAGAVPNPNRKFALKLFSAQEPLKQEGHDDKLSRADILAQANTESIANYEFRLGCAVSRQAPTLFPAYLGLVRLQCRAQKDTTICTQAEPTQRATTQCLITDFVKGKTLAERAQTTYPLSRVLELIKVLFHRLEPIRMTHYDLHVANVMIEDDPTHGEPWGGPGSTILRHAIKIIDMGRAHVHGALEPNVRYRCDGSLSFMIMGTHQGVFDPHIDFLQCLSSLQAVYNDNDIVLELLTELVNRWVSHSRMDMDTLGSSYLSVLTFDHAMQMELNPFLNVMEEMYAPSVKGTESLEMWNMDDVPPVEWEVLRETRFKPWLAEVQALPTLVARRQWRIDHRRAVWEALASLKKWYMNTYQGIVEFKKGDTEGTQLNRKQMVAWLSEILDRYIALARADEVK